MKNEAIIKKMTLEEKVSLFSGKSTWETQDIEGLIPAMFFSDGPHGLRKQLGESDHLGLNESVPATCFPPAATLANSWDESLLYEVGQCIGEEAKALDVQVVLGPGLNTKRNPKCGRNFEYYSEDPFLAGKLAAASIRGIQANGTIASPKHFAANSQEYRRMASDSIVDERAFRELYTTNFEIAVKEGHARSIMSSYNLINGIYANENHYLLRDILRDDWGFEGFVVSDWGGDNDHTEGVKNGSHLAMPSPGKNGPIEIIESVKNGRLTEAVLDERVDELLTVIFESTAGKTNDPTIDWESHHQIAKEAAMKSIVLLKNDVQVLPISEKQKVAIIGDFAKDPRYQGAGSSVVNPKNLENTLDALSDYPINMIGYAKGYNRGGVADERLVKEAVELAGKSDVVVLYVGLDEIFESEGMDRSTIKMPPNQIELIEKVAKTEAKIVVVLSAGSVVECDWEANVDGILHGYLSGEAGASAMLEVLCGNYNPSGKLNETYPLSYEDVPFGETFPAKGKNAYYMESIFVGYRYYDAANIAVRYPFGYGLSYTEFTYENLMVSKNGITATITNIGTVPGEEIVQLYIRHWDSKILRPEKELKGFKKIYLEPNESKQVAIPFDDKSFRYYNTTTYQWEIEAGDYLVMIGSHSRNIRLKSTIAVDGTTAVNPEEKLNLEKYKTLNFSHLSLADFQELYGKAVPIEETNSKRVLQPNNVISELKYAKNWIARCVYHVLNKLLKRSEKKGQPDLNLLFIYNMPFRAIAKMTNGMVSMYMVDEILKMVNGHFFKGITGLIQENNRNRKLQKAEIGETAEV